VVWDVSSGEAKQQYAFHTAPILAVDWANETTFATCSTDKLIQVCTVGERSPTRTLAGHTDEVNSLHWGSAPASGGRGVLASGSDDGTVRMWQSAASSDACLAVCSGHKKSVYAVRWAPTGEGSANPGKPALLASASFDGDIRLWDPAAPVPTRARSVLSRHSGNVYSVAWSPDGEYLASVASDKAVHVWSARDGALVRTLAGPAAGFQVAWSPDGGKLAACFANGALVTMDMRM
jgi:transducin (beta)-like 1